MKSSVGPETWHVLAALSATERTRPWLKRSLACPVRQTLYVAHQPHMAKRRAREQGVRQLVEDD